MKLITEHTTSDLDYIVEGTGKERSYSISGVFMQAEKKNRNGRIYEHRVLRPAVEKYVQEQVLSNRAVGELNHPEGPTVNLDKVSHRITDLYFEGNDVMGKALILDTPMGRIVKGLLDGGVQLGVSSRGMGSLVSKNGINYVSENFMLSTIDIVQDPSAPEAFVNGIFEGVEWVWENGLLKQQDVEKIETEIKEARIKNKTDLAIVQEKAFADFLSKL